MCAESRLSFSEVVVELEWMVKHNKKSLSPVVLSKFAFHPVYLILTAFKATVLFRCVFMIQTFMDFLKIGFQWLVVAIHRRKNTCVFMYLELCYQIRPQNVSLFMHNRPLMTSFHLCLGSFLHQSVIILNPLHG